MNGFSLLVILFLMPFFSIEITDEQRRYQTENSINSSGNNFSFASGLTAFDDIGVSQNLEKKWKSIIPTRLLNVM